jgi:hypothetical protein
MVQSPVALHSVIHERVLDDATPVFLTYLHSAVGAERIDDDNVVRKISNRFETTADIRFFVAREKDNREGITHEFAYRANGLLFQCRFPRSDFESMAVWHKRILWKPKDRKIQIEGALCVARK